MANCKYCGEPAGFFKSAHEDCQKKEIQKSRLAEGGRQLIRNAATRALKAKEDLTELQAKIAQLEKSSGTNSEQTRQALVEAWTATVDHYFNDGLIDQAEETALSQYIKHFSLSREELNKSGAFTRVAKSAVIREIVQGRTPAKFAFDGPLPINFLKTESLIWGFANTIYLKDKTRKTLVGSSHGTSVRISKGVTYKYSNFTVNQVERTATEHVDTGWLVLTDKNLYFAGPKKSTRLSFGKIISFQPYKDGIGIIREGDSAMPESFITGDGWFTYNMLVNLSQR